MTPPKRLTLSQTILQQVALRPGMSSMQLTMSVISKSIPYASEMLAPIRELKEAHRLVERTDANGQRGYYLPKAVPALQPIDVLRCIQKTTRDSAGKNQTGTAKDAWYERSYPVFTKRSHENDSLDGLVRVMAYASSWIPGVPSADPTQNPKILDELMALLESLQHQDATSTANRMSLRRTVIAKARAALGLREGVASIVLLSKALHFFRPSLVPMIDRNVGKAWVLLRAHFRSLDPRSITYPNEQNYLNYWETAWGLLQASKVQASTTSLPVIGYRELDVMLFNIGKRNLRITEP